jgi:hypothetical protein
MEVFSKLEDKNLSGKFSAETEFHKIGPWVLLSVSVRRDESPRVPVDSRVSAGMAPWGRFCETVSAKIYG